jgi:WD40 repeat protein
MRGLLRGMAAAVLAAVVVSAPAGAQGGGWRRAVNMSAARMAPAVASLPNGNVLVAGGVGQATAEVYDVASGQFVAVGRMSEIRGYATATALPDGTVLIAGGSGAGGSLDSAELYDPVTGSFTRLESRMSSRRERHTATLLPSGDVLLVGGLDTRSGTVGICDIYDVQRRTFRVTGALSLSRSSHAATYLPGDVESPAGYVLVVGGVRTVGDALVPQSTAEIYSLATGSFAPAGLMSARRERPTVTYLPLLQQALVIGGSGRDAQVAEQYDLAVRAFLPGPSLTFDRDGHQTVTLADGRLLVISGYSASQGRVVETAEIYSPGGEFTRTTNLASGRQDFGAALLPNGQVLVVGGRGSGTTALRTAEIFTP